METSLKHHQTIIEVQGQEIEVSDRPLYSLAAELGKTMRERNRELVTSIKHHQAIIEDQGQEIEVSARSLHRLAAELGKIS